MMFCLPVPIIQELGKNGIECVAMDFKRSIGTYSKYATYVNCPNPASDESGFVEFLYSYCKKENNKPVLFPTNDDWAVALSKHKKRLSLVSIPCVADWEAVRIVIEKDRFYKIGQENDYLTPFTWVKDELNQIPEDKFPLAVKPKFRRNSSDKEDKDFYKNMNRLRLVRIKDRDDLNKLLEKEMKYIDNLVFQEYVSGFSDQMYTVGIYSNQDYEVLGLFTGKKIRGYPAEIGDCIIGTNCNVPQFLLDNTKKVVRELKITGIAEFEYKKDIKTEKFKLIEINPRSWSWIGITPQCGVNLPLIAYKDITGEHVDYCTSELLQSTVTYSKVLKDFHNCLFKYKKHHPEWHKGFLEWFKEIRHAEKAVYAEFNAGDIMVSVKAISSFTRSFIRTLLIRN